MAITDHYDQKRLSDVQAYIESENVHTHVISMADALNFAKNGNIPGNLSPVQQGLIQIVAGRLQNPIMAAVMEDMAKKDVWLSRNDNTFGGGNFSSSNNLISIEYYDDGTRKGEIAYGNPTAHTSNDTEHTRTFDHEAMHAVQHMQNDTVSTDPYVSSYHRNIWSLAKEAQAVLMEHATEDFDYDPTHTPDKNAYFDQFQNYFLNESEWHRGYYKFEQGTLNGRPFDVAAFNKALGEIPGTGINFLNERIHSMDDIYMNFILPNQEMREHFYSRFPGERADVARLQVGMASLDAYEGIDGNWGPNSSSGFEYFTVRAQLANGLEPTGILNQETLDALRSGDPAIGLTPEQVQALGRLADSGFLQKHYKGPKNKQTLADNIQKAQADITAGRVAHDFTTNTAPEIFDSQYPTEFEHSNTGATINSGHSHDIHNHEPVDDLQEATVHEVLHEEPEAEDDTAILIPDYDESSDVSEDLDSTTGSSHTPAPDPGDPVAVLREAMGMDPEGGWDAAANEKFAQLVTETQDKYKEDYQQAFADYYSRPDKVIDPKTVITDSLPGPATFKVMQDKQLLPPEALKAIEKLNLHDNITSNDEYLPENIDMAKIAADIQTNPMIDLPASSPQAPAPGVAFTPNPN